MGPNYMKSEVNRNTDEITTIKEEEQENDSVIVEKIKRLRKKFAGQAVRELDIYNIPEYILNEIDEFSPEVIYSLLGSNSIMHLVTTLADRFSVAIVPHFMDDWPTTLYHSSIFKGFLRRIMDHRLADVLQRSSQRLVIGDEMANEFSRRYGGKFEQFMNAVEVDDNVKLENQNEHREIIRLVYIGGLHLNRWRSLMEVGFALHDLWNDGIKAEALIYCQPRFNELARKLNNPPVIRFAGNLLPSEVESVLHDADILLHVESFDRTSRTYAKYSISTKIPESMFAARPILAYGPEELASIQYVENVKAGIVVGSPNKEILLGALRRID